MNIVILEDEAIMMMFLKNCLESKEHKVKASFNSYKGFFEFIQKEEIDLVFLDIMVEGSLDGTQIARKLRAMNSKIKIVFITSYKDSETIQMAKLSKPNGYLIKPISKEDIEAILMICEPIEDMKTTSEYIFVSNYKFNIFNKTLQEDEKIIKLTKNELICFELLLKNKENYISHENLINNIWKNTTEDKTNSLRELVYRLRKKLPKIEIENSINIGYILKEK